MGLSLTVAGEFLTDLRAFADHARVSGATIYREPQATALPAEPKCVPKRETDDQPGDNHRENARCEVRIHHQQQTRREVWPPLLFLPVNEQHESNATREERDEKPGGIKRHRSDQTAIGRGSRSLYRLIWFAIVIWFLLSFSHESTKTRSFSIYGFFVVSWFRVPGALTCAIALAAYGGNGSERGARMQDLAPVRSEGHRGRREWSQRHACLEARPFAFLRAHGELTIQQIDSLLDASEPQ
jgi:hypothetical protein